MNFNKLIKENAVTIVLFVALINYGIIHFCVIDGHIAAAGLQDYGFMSVLTLLCIASAQITSLWSFTQSSNKRDKLTAFALFIILSVYFMREADLHRFFTHKTVTSIKYYLNPHFCIGGKIVAASILAIFLLSFGYILFKYSIPTIKAFFKGEPFAVAVGFWGTLLVISQIWDKMNLPDIPWRLKLMEEYIEFSASAYLPIMVILYMKKKKVEKKLD